MSIKVNRFKQVSFDNPSAIEFIGFVPCFDYSAFRVIGSNGEVTKYIGELAPNDLLNHRTFPIVTEAYADAVAKGSDVSGVPMGICADIRIVGTLLCVAFPKGIGMKIPDFANIDKCVSEKKRIELLSTDDAMQVVSYAPYDEKWLKRKLESTFESDTEPNTAISL